MPTFDCKVLDRDGAARDLLVAGVSEDEVITRLRVKGYYPLQILRSRESSGSISVADVEEAPPSKLVEITTKDMRLQRLVLEGDDEAWNALVEWCRSPQKVLQELKQSMRFPLESELFDKMERAHRKVAEHVLQFQSAAEFRENAAKEEKRQKEIVFRIRGGDFNAIRHLNSIPFGRGILKGEGPTTAGTVHLADVEGFSLYVLPDDPTKPPVLMLPVKELRSATYGGWFRKSVSLKTRGGKLLSILAERGDKEARLSRLARILQYEIRKSDQGNGHL